MGARHLNGASTKRVLACRWFLVRNLLLLASAILISLLAVFAVGHWNSGMPHSLAWRFAAQVHPFDSLRRCRRSLRAGSPQVGGFHRVPELERIQRPSLFLFGDPPLKERL